MSNFVLRRKSCPHCGDTVERTVAVSLNGGRSPHYRQAILDGKFQRFTCDKCGKPSLVDDPFIYIDFDRRDWIGVFPAAWEAEWRKHEKAPQAAFDQNMTGESSSPAAREMAVGFRVRTVFGLPALREKLVVADARLDDQLVEALKLDLMRTLPALGLDPRSRPRLVAVDDSTLRFVAPVADEAGERRSDEIEVPRSVYDAAVADRTPHRAALESLRAGAYVDVGRILLGGRAAA